MAASKRCNVEDTPPNGNPLFRHLPFRPTGNSYHWQRKKEPRVNIYLTQNDQKSGLYSFLQAQRLLASGAAQLTDWAWYEGLPNWIPLSQIPGMIPASPQAPVERPLAVWIICIFYFGCFPLALLGIALMALMTNGLFPVKIPPEQLAALHQTAFDYAITGVSMVLNLAWSIQFFRLKRQALYLYLASIALGIFTTGYHFVFKHQLTSANTALTLIILVLCWTINLVLLGYIWHLSRKGVLR
jgi:hypothetical protein